MASQDLPPVPHQAPMLDSNGFPTPVWSDWFKRLFVRVGGHHANDTDWANGKSANGYQKLPSGILVQWGVTASLASGSSTAISFPTAFPTACLQVIAGLKDMSGAATTSTGHFGTGAYNASSFSLYNRTSNAYVFNWIATGY